MTSFVLALLLATPQLSDDCPGDDRISVSPFDTEAPRAPEEASGPGLWIAGTGFDAGDVASGSTRYDEYVGRWTIDITLSERGSAKFIGAQRCRIGTAMEISVDGRVITAPYLNEPITGGQLSIGGNFSEEEARSLLAEILAPHTRAGAA